MILKKKLKINWIFLSFFLKILSVFLIEYYSIDLKRQSEHSGLRPNMSSYVGVSKAEYYMPGSRIILVLVG